jgi:hypothetical protein
VNRRFAADQLVVLFWLLLSDGGLGKMTAILFIVFLVATAIAVVALAARYVNTGAAFRLLAGLSVWFLYMGLMGYFGVARNAAMRPPGAAFILVPVVVFIVIFVFKARSLAIPFPVWLLVGGQSFRIGVELFLHRLWIAGMIPKMLTFAGANVDIFIGLSAPGAAWLATRGRTGMKAALAWNLLGLLSLANVVIRAVLTAPGPLNLIHAENPNLMIGTFPYLFIPGFFVPLAVVLHVLAMRAIKNGL